MPSKTKTTTVFELSQFGKIEKKDRNIRDLAPNEVIVKMHAASLNYRDYLVTTGMYNKNMPLPVVPLSDGAGEVVEVGSTVTRFKTGDRVMPIFMQAWISGTLNKQAAKSALGGSLDGVLQQEGIFPAESLVSIPSHLSYEEAATLPCAALTAWNALFEHGSVKPGNTVLALGTGGVSIFALQLAKAAGAQVIITSSSAEKLDRAKMLGADFCVNYRDNPDWDKTILQQYKDGVDHVIEVGGAGTLDRSMNVVRLDGHISAIGLLAQGQFDATKLLMKSIRLQGIFVGSREMFERMNAAIELHKIKPVIDRVFNVDQVQEALDTLKSGSHFGKIVLKF